VNDPEPVMDASSRMHQAAAWCARLSERVSSRDDAALLAWLAADPENRQAFEAVSCTLDNVEYFAGAPEMLKLREAALTEARRGRRSPLAARWVWAACIVLGVLGTGIATSLYLTRFSKVETGIGERRAFTLPDGSGLSLDAATQVRLSYSPERRQVVLARGRAKFDVAHDPLRPFMVEAGGKVVVATGTSFSVELVGQQVHVILYEGRIEVVPVSTIAARMSNSLRHPETHVDTALNPGQELVATVDDTPEIRQVASIDIPRSLSWQGGDLAFKEEPLSIAVARVNRYLDRPLKVGDRQAGEVRISGVFHAGDAGAFVDGVTALFPIRSERTQDGTTLVFEPRSKN
jgi:transmembrane sensor